MLFLLVKFRVYISLDLGRFHFQAGLPLGKFFEAVTHLIHLIEVSDVELLGDLFGPLFDHSFEVKFGFLASGYLRLQKLLKRFQSR